VRRSAYTTTIHALVLGAQSLAGPPADCRKVLNIYEPDMLKPADRCDVLHGQRLRHLRQPARGLPHLPG
jgi:hypothetical protein